MFNIVANKLGCIQIYVVATLMTRSELGLVMLDGYVYAVGGWDGRSRLDSVERYDPGTNTWQG
jgi:hypothetical protein